MRAVHLRNEAAGLVCGRTAVDILVFTFNDAKVVLMAYNAFDKGLKTLCMVNFEEDATGVGAAPIRGSKKGAYTFTKLSSHPELRIDPLQR